jgi:hypothetical protein
LSSKLFANLSAICLREHLLNQFSSFDRYPGGGRFYAAILPNEMKPWRVLTDAHEAHIAIRRPPGAWD